MGDGPAAFRLRKRDPADLGGWGGARMLRWDYPSLEDWCGARIPSVLHLALLHLEHVLESCHFALLIRRLVFGVG